jgi:polyisoprenoid-binding protein YceI
MPSYYQEGERFYVDPKKSEARFHLHAMGVPTLRGTLPVAEGELLIDAERAIRSAHFTLDALAVALTTPSHHPPKGLLGDAANPVIEFETQWARRAGPEHNELDGVLHVHGQAHLMTVWAQHGSWNADASGAEWYRALVSGGLDRKAWELRSHTLADSALLLLGHEVHFEVLLRAGPRITP